MRNKLVNVGENLLLPPLKLPSKGEEKTIFVCL